MGIENREYLRDEYDGPGPLRFSTSSVLVKIIGVTIAVFILQIASLQAGGGSPITRWLMLTADDVFLRGQIWRLLTYAFCHSEKDLLHIIFNMMVLYSVGNMLLSLLGTREFLWFYMASAIFAGICSVAFYSLFDINAGCVGASGAVMAVFCVVAMHYPRQRMLIMGVVPVEMRWLLAAYVAFDSFPILTGAWRQSNTGHAAHLGGLLFGFLYVRWHMQLTRWWDNFAGRMAMKRRNKGKLKIFAPPASTDSNLDAQMDSILEKISREGEASLTQRERNILIQASKKLRKDRN